MRLPTQWLGVAPFFIFALMFLILPTAYLDAGRVSERRTASSRSRTSRALSQPSIVAAYWISIKVSLASAILGALDRLRHRHRHRARRPAELDPLGDA